MTSVEPTIFPFVSGLSADGRRDLGRLVVVRSSAHKPLLEWGDPAGGAYLVTHGSLRVYYVTDGGREATLYHVEPGGTCVLALGATINDAPFPAWVQTGPHGAHFVRVPPPLFHRMVDREPAFRQFVLSALGGRIFNLMAKLEEVASTQLEQRLAHYLLRWQDAAGIVTGTQSTIAAELGTAREVVSRTVRALEQQGLIDSGRARITIRDHGALERFAGRAAAHDPEGSFNR